MTNTAEPLFFEVGTAQINKFGEELCGDRIIVNQAIAKPTVILSDGLGSGVKANILSTLTSQIISVMLQNGCSLDEVVDTLIETLPTCSVRKLAYSTFSVAQLQPDGIAHLVEYDNPPVMFLRGNRLQKVNYIPHDVKGKKIKEAELSLQHGDILVFMSDGEVHAGIGGVWNLGWGWDRIAEFVERVSKKEMTAQDIAFELTNVANELYGEKPGDDTSAAVIRVRHKRYATVMVGAPSRKEEDPKIVGEFMTRPGRKIICGGTTSNIISRELNRKLTVDLSTLLDGIPPIGWIQGIDLCTEGIITITRTLKLLLEKPSYKRLEIGGDGVSRLAKELLFADEIAIYIGQSMNPAHQTANMPSEFGLKTQIMEKVANYLRGLNKQVTIIYC